MQSTYWLEKVLKMISLYVNALLCTLQHIVIHVMQISGVNSENWHRIWLFSWLIFECLISYPMYFCMYSFPFPLFLWILNYCVSLFSLYVSPFSYSLLSSSSSSLPLFPFSFHFPPILQPLYRLPRLLPFVPPLPLHTDALRRSHNSLFNV